VSVWRVGLGGLLAVCCTGAPGPQGKPAAPAENTRPPDILLIVLDTTRADAVSLGDGSRPTTRQIAAIAEAGVAFTDVTAPASWTWPSHASLFTGQPPWVHGARTRSDAPVDDERRVAHVWPMRTDLPTLAGELSKAGYHTESLSQNRWLAPSLGLTRGFAKADVFEGCTAIEAALGEAMVRADAEPAFVFVNLLEPHAPWNVTPAAWAQPHVPRLKDDPGWMAPFVTDQPLGLDLYRTPKTASHSGFQSIMRGDLSPTDADYALIRDLYDADVAATDYCVHRLLEAWKLRRELGVVVVTSDHGEYLGEHGLMEHGQTIWPEVTGVPLVMAGPGLPKGQTVDTPVQLQDVPGTLLALAGVPSDMTSLLPVVAGQPRLGPIQAAAWKHPDPAQAIGGRFEHDWFWYRQGDHAIAFSPTSTAHLYDLSTDPGATTDLADTQPERLAELLAKAEGAFEVHKLGHVDVSLPPDVEAHLRAIGYLPKEPEDGAPTGAGAAASPPE